MPDSTHQWRPDYNSDGQEHPTNEERAEWAGTAIDAFVTRIGEDETRTHIQDLITDLGHYADMMKATGDLEEDFETLVEWALENWREER